MKNLLPETKARIKLVRARPKFSILSDNASISLKLLDCSLFTRNILVADSNNQYLQKNLEKEPAQNNYVKTVARAFITPSPQNQFIQEIIIKNASIRRTVVAMSTNLVVVEVF